MPRKKVIGKPAKTSDPSLVAEPTVGYVVTPRKKAKELKPLTDDDWAVPGRPATDEELEKLVKEMMREKGGYTLEEARAITKKKIAAWKKAHLR